MGHVLGITMGDPSGVGPEIICKALAALPAEERARSVLLGDLEIARRANRLVGAGLELVAVEPGREEIPPAAGPRQVRVVAIGAPERDTIRDGEVSAGGGHAAYAYVCRAVELARDGAIDVIVTAPLNKAALHAAGHLYDGHTGLLQSLTGAPAVFMLLASPRLSTIHVSTHVSLAEAVARCRRERVLATIEAGDAHLREIGLDRPRIAVAGINPHCGEGGIFGREDDEQIAPAVRAARAAGIEAHGPLPGDTVFLRASRGEFDLVVAQYHDQGHIPTKLIAFETAVNVSLGLPVRRTSVDHGTAFDIAWTGRASPENMLAAMSYARRLAATQAKRR